MAILGTRMPNGSTELPSSLGAAPELHARAFNGTPPSTTATLKSVHIKNIGNFGRLAQATYLLDHVLQLVALSPCNPQKLAGLVEADQSIRTYLSHVFDEGGWVRGFLCASISTAVRCVKRPPS
ncbi:MAG: hypothetical protein INR71_10880 [Terriglobus roseus]|nr:hypothetical protein [Terriglobus roseus]